MVDPLELHANTFYYFGMSGELPADAPPLHGTDGQEYYTFPAAARRLDISADTAKRELEPHAVRADGLVTLSGPGRPPAKVVPASIVEEERLGKLRRLGVFDDAREHRRITSELMATVDELSEEIDRLCGVVADQNRELEELRPLRRNELLSRARAMLDGRA